MTPRERVLTTIQQQEPDKMPIDCGSMRSTGIMAMAYADLKRELGIEQGRIRVYDFFQQLAEIEKPILDLFEVDVVDIVNTSLCSDGREWQPFRLPDGTMAEAPPEIEFESDGEGGYRICDEEGNVTHRMPEGCLYFETVQPPLGSERKDVEAYNIPLFTEEELQRMHHQAKTLYETTDYALMGGFGGNILEAGQMLRGWGNFMMDLGDDDGFAQALIDHFVDIHLQNLDRYLEAVGDYIQLIQMGDDLGTQSAPQMSEKTYEKFIHPAHKKIYLRAKERCPHIKVFFHCCGSCSCYIPYMLKEGVDVLNPVQITAAHMEPNDLKNTFGDQITYWGGGCDTQHILPKSSPDEVKKHAQDLIRIFAPGGGYVFTSIHNVQAHVPPKNVIAMYEAAKEMRDYPIG